MNLSTVKGYLRELLVKAKLESEKLQVEQTGNQSGYDLKVSNSTKIDVKFSILKNECGANGKYYGWALVQKSKKRPLTCSHIVCVGVNENLKLDCLYVIPKKHIYSFPAGAGQFNGVKNGFLITQNNKNPNFQQIFP